MNEYIINNHLIYCITFCQKEKIQIFVNIDKGNIYYTIEKYYDGYTLDKVYDNMIDEYVELIKIVKPKISNCGWGVLWLDNQRINSEKSFEGKIGFLSDIYLSNILIENKYILQIPGYGVIFRLPEWNSKLDILKDILGLSEFEIENKFRD